MKIVYLIFFLTFGVQFSFSQSLMSKRDTMDGFFLVESYWDQDLDERRQLLLPIDLSTYFRKNNVCFDYQFLDYSFESKHSKRNEEFSRLLLNLLTGNTSSIDINRFQRLELPCDNNNSIKYFIFYVRFTYKKRGIIKKSFPKFDKRGNFKKMVKKSVIVYDIVNVLDYKGSIGGR